MTEKLYDQDSHLAETTARVLSCKSVSGGYDVLLDRTVFFPEGGGQPSDTGRIASANVLHCREERGEVLHLTDAPLPAGETVPVRLDWQKRFDFMQQHTGEHLLSFAFYRLFGAANVGFHLAPDYATIDFDRPLGREQIAEAERLANTFVWRNLPVTATFYDSEEAIRDLPLRKHAEGLTAPIRIVSIEDADQCTCCAPHCSRTGEIGLIFVVESAAYKGGTRITFFCGSRALSHARATHDDADAIARRFSASRSHIVAAVDKLADDYGALKRREKELVRELNGYIAASLEAEAEAVGPCRLIVRLFDGMDAERLRELAQTAATSGTLVLLLSASGEKLLYVFAAGEGCPVTVSDGIAAVNAAFGGRGGGRGALAQGAAPYAKDAADGAERLRREFAARLNARG